MQLQSFYKRASPRSEALRAWLFWHAGDPSPGRCKGACRVCQEGDPNYLDKGKASVASALAPSGRPGIALRRPSADGRELRSRRRQGARALPSSPECGSQLPRPPSLGFSVPCEVDVRWQRSTSATCASSSRLPTCSAPTATACAQTASRGTWRRTQASCRRGWRGCLALYQGAGRHSRGKEPQTGTAAGWCTRCGGRRPLASCGTRGADVSGGPGGMVIGSEGLAAR